MAEHEFIMHGNQLILDGRKIGWITRLANGKKIFVSPRNRMGKDHKGRGHYFNVFSGFGLAVSVFEFLKRNQFDEIHLKIGQAETLITSLDVWEKHGIPYQRKPLFEAQLILPEKHMTKVRKSLSELLSSP